METKEQLQMLLSVKERQLDRAVEYGRDTLDFEEDIDRLTQAIEAIEKPPTKKIPCVILDRGQNVLEFCEPVQERIGYYGRFIG